MADETIDLTGVWSGLYSYTALYEPVHFVATLIAHGEAFSGTTHEDVPTADGGTITIFAMLNGSKNGDVVEFKKEYDEAAQAPDAINYSGLLSADGNEIEGRWVIPNAWSGKFLMIRSSSLNEAALRDAFEKIPV